tara:strand:- start:13754 stop:14419 length:666 start_codon:yes stop_codon:yes gene_type:complete
MEPPFSGKKKHEFPDAFSIKSILEHLQGDNAYVISEDSDLIDFCSTQSNLFSIKTIEEFLDTFNEYENITSTDIKKLVINKTSLISSQITEKLEESDAFNDQSCWEDSEVIDFDVLRIYEFDPLVLSINENTCLIAFDVNVDIGYTVSGPDFLNGHYDKESGNILALEKKIKTEAVTQSFSVEIWYDFIFDKESRKIVDIHENSFGVLNLIGGLFAEVEEN